MSYELLYTCPLLCIFCHCIGPLHSILEADIIYLLLHYIYMITWVITYSTVTQRVICFFFYYICLQLGYLFYMQHMKTRHQILWVHYIFCTWNISNIYSLSFTSTTHMHPTQTAKTHRAHFTALFFLCDTFC